MGPLTTNRNIYQEHLGVKYWECFKVLNSKFPVMPVISIPWHELWFSQQIICPRPWHENPSSSNSTFSGTPTLWNSSGSVMTAQVIFGSSKMYTNPLLICSPCVGKEGGISETFFLMNNRHSVFFINVGFLRWTYIGAPLSVGFPSFPGGSGTPSSWEHGSRLPNPWQGQSVGLDQWSRTVSLLLLEGSALPSVLHSSV